MDAIRSYAPGLIFTTSRPPVVAAGAAASVAHLKTDGARREAHQTRARILKARLKGLGLPIVDHGTHIVPLIVGALAIAFAGGSLLDDVFRRPAPAGAAGDGSPAAGQRIHMDL